MKLTWRHLAVIIFLGVVLSLVGARHHAIDLGNATIHGKAEGVKLAATCEALLWPVTEHDTVVVLMTEPDCGLWIHTKLLALVETDSLRFSAWTRVPKGPDPEP